jgi:hypothetical protein
MAEEVGGTCTMAPNCDSASLNGRSRNLVIVSTTVASGR